MTPEADLYTFCAGEGSVVSPELLAYIRKEELQGYTPMQLHEYLVHLGYPEADVEEAIREAGATQAYSAPARHWAAYDAARGAPQQERRGVAARRPGTWRQAAAVQPLSRNPPRATAPRQERTQAAVQQEAPGGQVPPKPPSAKRASALAQRLRRFRAWFLPKQAPPTGVVVLAVLHGLLGFCCLLFGLLLRWSVVGLPEFLALFRFVVTGFAVVLIVIGLYSLLVAWGLWALRRWARVLALAFSVLGFLSVAGVPLSVAVLYVLTREEVKRAFS